MKKKNLLKVHCLNCGKTFYIKKKDYHFSQKMFPYKGHYTIAEPSSQLECPWCELGVLKFTSYIKEGNQQ